ncbi:MAG: hypothetical protein ACK6AO_10815 [Planctomycetota bacterium]
MTFKCRAIDPIWELKQHGIATSRPAELPAGDRGRFCKGGWGASVGCISWSGVNVSIHTLLLQLQKLLPKLDNLALHLRSPASN